MKKRLDLIFTGNGFENFLLYKDVGLLPYYLKKEYDLEVKIICSNRKKKIQNNFRGMEIIELKYYFFGKVFEKILKFKILKFFNYYKYLLKNAKKINYLMLFHIGLDKFFLVLLYRFLNKSGKIYIKMDSDISGVLNSNNENTSFIRKIQKIFLKNLIKRIDLISIETKEAYEEILKSSLYNMDISNKITYIPNGFDEEYLKENDIKVKSFEEKENIMITVGRIGTEQKNNEMLLESLDGIDLKNWKIFIIGSYTKEFKNKYDEFIKNNQDKKESVILTGNIEDKNLLYDYYNKEKVFLLTSRYESFGIVLSEALRFGEYIITTDVGAAKDITDNGNIGAITEIENITQFRNEILKVLNDKINLEEKYDKSLELSKKQFLWNEIVKNKKFKEFFNEE